MQSGKKKKPVKKRKAENSQSKNQKNYIVFPSINTVSLNLAKCTKESLLNLWTKTQLSKKRSENRIQKNQEEPTVTTNVPDKSKIPTTSVSTAEKTGGTNSCLKKKKKKKVLNKREMKFRSLAKNLIKDFKYFSRFEEKQPRGNTISFINTLRWMKKAEIVDNHRVTIRDVEVHFINNSKTGYGLKILGFIRFLKSLCEDRGLAMSSVILKLLSCNGTKIYTEKAVPTIKKTAGKCKVKYKQKKTTSCNNLSRKKCSRKEGSRISTMVSKIIKESLTILPEGSIILGKNRDASHLKEQTSWVNPTLQTVPFENEALMSKNHTRGIIKSEKSIIILNVEHSISSRKTGNVPKKSFSSGSSIECQNYNRKNIKLIGKSYNFAQDENYEFIDPCQSSDELCEEHDVVNQQCDSQCSNLNESSKVKIKDIKTVKTNSAPSGKRLQNTNKNLMNEDISGIVSIQRVSTNSKTEENLFDNFNPSKITVENEPADENKASYFSNPCDHESSLKVLSWMDKSFNDSVFQTEKTSKKLKRENPSKNPSVKSPGVIKMGDHKREGSSTPLNKKQTIFPKNEKQLQKTNNTQGVEFVPKRNKIKSVSSNFRKMSTGNKKMKVKKIAVSPSRNKKKVTTPKCGNKSIANEEKGKKQSDKYTPSQNINKNISPNFRKKSTKTKNISSRKGNGVSPLRSNEKDVNHIFRSKSAHNKEISNKQVYKLILLGNDKKNISSNLKMKSTDNKKISDKNGAVSQTRNINKNVTENCRIKLADNKKMTNEQNGDYSFPRNNNKRDRTEISNKQNDEFNSSRNSKNVSLDIRQKYWRTEKKNNTQEFKFTTPKNKANSVSPKFIGISMHNINLTNETKPFSQIKTYQSISCYNNQKSPLPTQLNKAKQDTRLSENIHCKRKSPLKKSPHAALVMVESSKKKQLAKSLGATILPVKDEKTNIDCKSEQFMSICNRNRKEKKRTFTNLPEQQVQKKLLCSKMSKIKAKRLKVENSKTVANCNLRKTTNKGQKNPNKLHSSFSPRESMKMIGDNNWNSDMNNDSIGLNSGEKIAKTLKISERVDLFKTNSEIQNAEPTTAISSLNIISRT